MSSTLHIENTELTETPVVSGFLIPDLIPKIKIIFF